MNLNQYFDHVCLERDNINFFSDNESFCNHISINTPNNPIGDIGIFTHAIVGICEDRGSIASGSALSPDTIRKELYKLSSITRKIKVIDLGNIKNTENINDTYFGLRDILEFLFNNNVIPILIGGSHDISYSVALAFTNKNKGYTLTTIDNKADYIVNDDKKITSSNYLKSIFNLASNLPYFNYYNLGNQACYTFPGTDEVIQSKWFEMVRLGLLRNHIQETEPYIRESDFVSIDISSVKQADAPGQSFASPNGFNADEICQIARYCGFSENLKVLGLFEVNPLNDINSATSVLAAQIIWYYLDAYIYNNFENPSMENENFKKYVISNNNPNNELVYYNSLKTDRWWCEIKTEKLDANYFLPCTEQEYMESINNEIPERWFKAFKRIN